MAEFKKGQKVRVSYEAEYDAPAYGGWHRVLREPYGPLVPADATIEVVEEPYEEGAVYEFAGRGGGYRMAYLPEEGNKPWVYISGWHRNVNFGKRFREGDGPAVKLAPVE